jgi:dynein heavy chain
MKLLFNKFKQVDFWKNKVDKACIERIRGFQNPPALIGQIMEMIMTLVGKKKFPDQNQSVQKSESTTTVSKDLLKELEKSTDSQKTVKPKPSKALLLFFQL